jgi:hypothetical protein
MAQFEENWQRLKMKSFSIFFSSEDKKRGNKQKPSSLEL